jgi:hypothetical protein
VARATNAADQRGIKRAPCFVVQPRIFSTNERALKKETPMNLLKAALALGSVTLAREVAQALQHVDLSNVLEAVGLERKPRGLRGALPAVALVTLGAAVGAGTALLLAPTSGREFRARISGKVEQARDQLSERLREFEGDRG